jgi:hypothetical protein
MIIRRARWVFGIGIISFPRSSATASARAYLPDAMHAVKGRGLPPRRATCRRGRRGTVAVGQARARRPCLEAGQFRFGIAPRQATQDPFLHPWLRDPPSPKCAQPPPHHRRSNKTDRCRLTRSAWRRPSTSKRRVSLVQGRDFSPVRERGIEEVVVECPEKWHVLHRRNPAPQAAESLGLGQRWANPKNNPRSNVLPFPNRINVVHEEGLAPAAEAAGRSEGPRTPRAHRNVVRGRSPGGT